ncbi:MAG: aminoglycoside phosphotransferase family protein [Candidatus Electrothrix sp. AR3]|nr:aminoglycoside phosphotransferase family protein [Candidatus Electrothrix sp. AR3]
MKACEKAFSFFMPQEKIIALESLSTGLINDTWLAGAQSGNYVLQRLNSAVFPDLALVQKNICRVTEHLQAELNNSTGSFKFFRVLRNPFRKAVYLDDSGSYWRLLSYIDNSKTFHSVTELDQARELGAALGLFHRLVSTLPSPSLADPLPGLHNTPLYLFQYDNLLPVASNPEAADCRDFIAERRKAIPLLAIAHQQGRITEQVVHGDPKVANFLFSEDGKQVISLVDLDTVRPGLLLHDLGDCLRSCCNPMGEEVQQPEDVVFEQELFAAVLNGYLSHTAELLTPDDRRLIVDSAHLLSLELGLRFYSDYLAGNCYFKVKYPKHNLFRARVQFALVRSIEQQYNALRALESNS